MRLGLPLVGGHLAGFAIHMSDTIMLGWYSVDALAASVLGSSYFFVLFILGSGFGQAVMPVVASALGAGETAQVRRGTRMAMWLSVAFGILVLPLFLWAAPILDLFGQPPEVAKLAGIYLSVVGFGMIPALLVQVFRSYLSALERAGIVFWVTVAALVVNVGVNYVLIFGNFGAPEMGILGAAVASITVQVVSILGVAAYAAIVTPEHALFTRIWRPDLEALAEIFRLGWPIGITAVSEVGLFAAAALMMGWVGTIDLAAHGIAIQVAAIFFLFHMGLAQAGTVHVGLARGRGDWDGVRRVAITSNAISGIFALFAVIVYLTCAGLIIGLFLHPDDPVRPQVIATGTLLLYVAAAFQLADAGQAQALNLLRGLHDTRIPMVMAAVSYWLVGMPISYFLGFTAGWGGVGVWTGLTLGLVCAWVLMGRRLWLKIAPQVQAIA